MTIWTARRLNRLCSTKWSFAEMNCMYFDFLCNFPLPPVVSSVAPWKFINKSWVLIWLLYLSMLLHLYSTLLPLPLPDLITNKLLPQLNRNCYHADSAFVLFCTIALSSSTNSCVVGWMTSIFRISTIDLFESIYFLVIVLPRWTSPWHLHCYCTLQGAQLPVFSRPVVQ
jgi:hypothetical protein